MKNKNTQFADDCIELNQILGNTLDDFESSYKGKRAEVVITEVVPVVLAELLAKHFKHFNYNKPNDILTYLNYLKYVFVTACDDSEELDMIDSIDYGSEVQA